MATITNGQSGSVVRAALNATGLRKSNFAATAAPVAGDDTADGYEVGSLWLNTTNGYLYCADDVSAGAAVWNLIYPQASGSAGVTIVTSDPTATDASPTYLQGAFVLNETLDRLWVCIDDTPSAAVWQRIAAYVDPEGLTEVTSIDDADRIVLDLDAGGGGSAPASVVVRGDATAQRMVVLTATAYAALTPKVATTVYLIVG